MPGAFAGVTVGTVLTNMAIGVVASIGTAFVMQGVNRLFFTEDDIGARDRGRDQVFRNPVAPHRWIYGEVQVAGMLAYAETYGASPPNEFLSLIIVLAAHECEAIGDTILVNDDEITLEFDSPNNRWIPPAGNKYRDNLWIYKHLGDVNQVADAELVAQSAGLWTTNHRGRGRAYVHAQLRYNESLYQGLPNLRFLVRGRKIYDTANQQTAWSSSPPLAARDYLVEALKYPAAEMDDAIFTVSRNVAAENVPLKGGGTQDRYRCHGTIELSELPADVIGDLLVAQAGSFTWINGKYAVHAGAPSAPVMTITERHLRGPVVVNARRSGRDLFNTVRGTFNDQRNQWQPVDFPVVDSAQAIADDNNQVLTRDVRFPFENNSARAQRLAKIELQRTRQQITCVLPCKLIVLQTSVWDTVLVDLPRYGWANKKFRVVSWRFGLSESWGIDLLLAEEADSLWDWDPNQDEKDHDPAPDTILPNPFDQAPPTGVTVTESSFIDAKNPKDMGQVTVTWTAPAASAYLSRYEVRLRRVGAPDWGDAQVVDRVNTRAVFGALKLTDDYEGAVRAVGVYAESVWVSSTSGALAGDTTPPALPALLDISSPAIRSLRIRWTNPADADFSHVEIAVRTDTGTPGPTDIRKIAPGKPSDEDQWTYENLAPDTDRYVRFRSVDITGNKSAWSAANGPYQTKRAITDDVTDDAISNPKIQDNATARTASANQDNNVAIPATWTTLATAATASDGSSVQLHFTSAVIGGVDGSSITTGLEFRLRRDSTNIRNWAELPFNEERKFVSFQHRDSNPPAGSNTYTVQARRVEGSVDGGGRDNELSLTESRK